MKVVVFFSYSSLYLLVNLSNSRGIPFLWIFLYLEVVEHIVFMRNAWLYEVMSLRGLNDDSIVHVSKFVGPLVCKILLSKFCVVLNFCVVVWILCCSEFLCCCLNFVLFWIFALLSEFCVVLNFCVVVWILWLSDFSLGNTVLERISKIIIRHFTFYLKYAMDWKRGANVKPIFIPKNILASTPNCFIFANARIYLAKTYLYFEENNQ